MTTYTRNTSWYTMKRQQILKVFLGLLTLTSLCLPLTSLWFILTTSTLFGSLYYFLCETQPQLMFVFSMVIQCQIKKIKNKFILWSSYILQTKEKYSENMLQTKDNLNILEYYDNAENNHKKYKIYFKQNLRSNDLIIFKDEFDNDITDKLEPYLGPMQNFHGIPFTPGDFNHKKINIFRDGNICFSKIFEENEPLNFQN